jgi:hypothetical protein
MIFSEACLVWVGARSEPEPLDSFMKDSELPHPKKIQFVQACPMLAGACARCAKEAQADAQPGFDFNR